MGIFSMACSIDQSLKWLVVLADCRGRDRCNVLSTNRSAGRAGERLRQLRFRPRGREAQELTVDMWNGASCVGEERMAKKRGGGRRWHDAGKTPSVGQSRRTAYDCMVRLLGEQRRGSALHVSRRRRKIAAGLGICAGRRPRSPTAELTGSTLAVWEITESILGRHCACAWATACFVTAGTEKNLGSGKVNGRRKSFLVAYLDTLLP